MNDWQYETDFVSIGAGSGGMAGAITAAACGMDALVIEQAAVYGGTTSMSGGVIWVPNNMIGASRGIEDSEKLALDYLKAVVPDADSTRYKTFVRHAPRMLRFMAEHSSVRYDLALDYMDYYPEHPGALHNGRSLDPLPFDSNLLGADLEQLKLPEYSQMRLPFSLTAQEAHEMMQLGPRMWWLFLRRGFSYYIRDLSLRLRGRPDRRLTMGRALTARLRYSLTQNKTPLWLNTAATELIVENDRVVGLVVRREGKELRVKTRRGVLIASGGFAANQAMREQYLEQPTDTKWSAGNSLDNGSGLRLGLDAGAALDFMRCAWWTPVYMVNKDQAEALIIGKSLPGSIFVNQAGMRFCNEAAPYEDVIKAQYQAHRKSPSIPCHFVFDAHYRHNFPCGPVAPGKVMADNLLSAEMKAFLNRSDTLEELAAKIGVDAEGLKRTIARHNEFAKSGKDLDFGRGESVHDRYYSDPTAQPNPNLRAIAKPPFYSFEIFPGDLGTKGGLRCDERGRALREDGAVIGGLYAAGNAAAAALGDSYPGAGATIASAMTFGYIAAHDAAGLDLP